MATEPVQCSSCSRKFSPRMGRCPFCNAERAAEAQEVCETCGRTRAPGLTACPFCFPELVAPKAPSTDASQAVRAAIAASPMHSDEPVVSKRLVMISVGISAVGLAATIACARHFDVIGPNTAGRLARYVGLIPLLVVGGWARAAGRRGGSLGWEQFRSVLLGLVLLVLPASLVAYPCALLINSWASDAAVDVTCTITSEPTSNPTIQCTLPTGVVVRGQVRAAPLQARIADARSFVVPARHGALGSWLIDVKSARPGAGAPERKKPLILAPGVPFAIPNEDGR